MWALSWSVHCTDQTYHYFKTLVLSVFSDVKTKCGKFGVAFYLDFFVLFCIKGTHNYICVDICFFISEINLLFLKFPWAQILIPVY